MSWTNTSGSASASQRRRAAWGLATERGGERGSTHASASHNRTSLVVVLGKERDRLRAVTGHRALPMQTFFYFWAPRGNQWYHDAAMHATPNEYGPAQPGGRA